MRGLTPISGGFSGVIAAAARAGNGSGECCGCLPYFLLALFTPVCNETTTPRNRMRSLHSSRIGGHRPAFGRAALSRKQ